MSQEETKKVLRLLEALERLARVLDAVPDELLAAWLVYDLNISKSRAKDTVLSLKRLLKVLGVKEVSG